jgi:hypothetical protein
MWFAAIPVTMSILLTGCSIGPKTVTRDRFEYRQALSRSAREELLMNIVQFRYMESPTFMSISSVVTQYSLEGTISANANWNRGSELGPDSAIGTGAASRFTDRPTITYSPMIGRQFTESILTPIRPEAVLALIESGWKVNVLFPLTVHSINGVRNRFYVADNRQDLDVQFKQVVDLMAGMQADGTVSIRFFESDVGESPGFVIFIAEAGTDEQRENVGRLKALLGLDPNTNRYKIVFGSAAMDSSEVALVTRSILAILIDMASYVRVPEEHLAEGRAAPGPPIEDGMQHPITVHSSEKYPEEAYVKIRYRDLWYWIDDRDLNSKRTFTILQMLANLAASPEAAQTPLLTIPAG